jgi:hypothetical protein
MTWGPLWKYFCRTIFLRRIHWHLTNETNLISIALQINTPKKNTYLEKHQEILNGVYILELVAHCLNDFWAAPKVLQENGHSNCIAPFYWPKWQRTPDVEEIKNVQKYAELE